MMFFAGQRLDIFIQFICNKYWQVWLSVLSRVHVISSGEFGCGVEANQVNFQTRWGKHGSEQLDQSDTIIITSPFLTVWWTMAAITSFRTGFVIGLWGGLATSRKTP